MEHANFVVVPMRLLILLFSSIILIDPSSAKTVVYFSITGEERIDMYDLDSDTGEISYVEGYKTGGGVDPLAIAPSKLFLYASVRSRQQLKTYAIDGESGRLQLIASIPDVSNSNFLSVDETGQYLLASYNAAGMVSVTELRSNGRPIYGSTRTFQTTGCAHMITTVLDNRYAYASHTCGNRIVQFEFNRGYLEELARYDAGRGQYAVFLSRPRQPRHFAVHPSNQWIYFDNEKDSSVSHYWMDADEGDLGYISTTSTVPRFYRPLDLLGFNKVAEIRITPDGEFLYVSNRGHDSIAGFAINPDDGSLSLVGFFPTEQEPRSFHISPDGQFLFAAGVGSGRLATYRIEDDGTLSSLEVLDLGQEPSWVEFLELP
jgi:6-phosphogluconolactonase